MKNSGNLDLSHVMLLGTICQFFVSIGQFDLAVQLCGKIRAICKILSPEMDFVSAQIFVIIPSLILCKVNKYLDEFLAVSIPGHQLSTSTTHRAPYIVSHEATSIASSPTFEESMPLFGLL